MKIVVLGTPPLLALALLPAATVGGSAKATARAPLPATAETQGHGATGTAWKHTKGKSTRAPLGRASLLKPLASDRRTPKRSTPADQVARANAAARVQPEGASWLNAIEQYPYAEGALYQVYAAPGRVTDIVLEPGEHLVGDGPVAAGDTVRWIIGDTVSGTGAASRVHILVKPTRTDLETNMVINTDRRSYHLELRANQRTYMAAVSWTYPHGDLLALPQASARAAEATPAATGIDPAHLAFGYRITGDKTAWRPLRAFDDGRQTFIEFPATIATADMPPLFVVGSDGKDALVNYRVQGRYLIVDRLFDAAELRLGNRKGEKRVRIVRQSKNRGDQS